ncbi:protein FAM184A-like isoform X1 [Pecten maximus]|uniref:protein FAM184A-like isoform X1 n=1 Tax=Pecten maximus TaxID=6579 RepID=UPI001458EF88|nr:protein FAM184A-like isoform X1 [Pecten maximus]XP_033749680.1 protein FAM184A-like isoform X1 [Pecten maximus]
MATIDKKKTFDFRMSKKVAELTQVVHMLFTRNHEKEVEIEAIKDAYEFELSLVLEDAEGRIASLDQKRKDLEALLDKERLAGRERVKEAIQEQADAREEQWKQQIQVLEKQLSEEKSDSQNLRDLLINAQKDIEKLREGVAEQLKIKNEEIQSKNRELERLRRLLAELEKSSSDKEVQYQEAIKELERTNEKLERELAQLQALLEETHRNKIQLEAKNVKLETDLKNLKKDFGRKVAEVVATQQRQQNQQQNNLPPPRSATNFTQDKNCSKNHQVNLLITRMNIEPISDDVKQDYNDEVEKLRKEVQRYRMELSNRDGNFNRMFSNSQPMVVDPRAGKIGVSQNQILSGNSATYTETIGLPVREKSFSYAFVQSIDDKQRPASSRISSATARLPSLTQEQRSRLTKLMKPRPLPKEMLYGK